MATAQFRSRQIADGAIIEAKIGALAVTNGKIAGNAVTTDKINDGAVTEDKLAAGAVTNVKLAANAVATSNIINGAVTEDKVGALAITEGKIGAGAVTEAKIGGNAVTNGKLGDNAVSADKIDTNAVTETKIIDNAVTDAKLADAKLSLANGGTVSGETTYTVNAPNCAVTPTEGDDLCNKTYVDTKFALSQSWRPVCVAYDKDNTSRPTGDPVTIDGVGILPGNRVLFVGLSVAGENNRVYKAEGTGTNITGWALETDGQAGTGAPTDGDTLFIQQGNTHADYTFNFDDTDWIPISATAQAHAASHETGGSDEITVTDLLGRLADPQDADVLFFNTALSLGNTDPNAGHFLTYSGGLIQGADINQLQGVGVSAGAPADGQVLTYNVGGSQWEPADLPNPTPINFADNEIPAGLINGSNPTFTLAQAPLPVGSLLLVLNGQVLEEGAGNDYTLSGSTITMAVPPTTGEKLVAWYRYNT